MHKPIVCIWIFGAALMLAVDSARAQSAAAPSALLDPSFDPRDGPDAPVKFVLVQPDGKLLIAGGFINYDGKPRRLMARLNSEGQLDEGFGVEWSFIGARLPSVDAIAVQDDAKPVVSVSYGVGFFGQSERRIVQVEPPLDERARANPAGVVDESNLWTASTRTGNGVAH